MTPPKTAPDSRPKRFPPPEFPPKGPSFFARIPPALFPPVLGFLGLALALRLALPALGLPSDPADLIGGVAVALWAIAAVAYVVKLLRRPGVVIEDLRVLPGRAGLAAMTMGGMVAASLIAPLWPDVATGLLVVALAAHAVLAVLLIRLLLSLAPPAQEVNPTWHLSFVGFIVAAPAATALGWMPLAEVLFWATLPIAVAIWGLSGMQGLRVLPPAALRPLLAVHVAPAGLLSTVAALLGKTEIAQVILMFGSLCAVVLMVYLRWIIEAGITPMWAAFTFPLAALATAMLNNGPGWTVLGLGLTALAVVIIPSILLWVLKRWPDGTLAQITNAAEA